MEDNDEAEQIIRAITHGEIDHQVYSQMADDLESAAQMKRAETKKTGKTKKVTVKAKKTKAKKTNAAGDKTSEPSASEVEPSASESNLVPSTA